MKKGPAILLTILTGGLAYAGYKGYQKNNAIDNLSISIKDIKVGFANKFMQTKIELLVKNPTSEALRFKNFTGKIYLDSQSLGNIDIANPVNISPKSTTPVTLSSTLPTNNIITTMASFLFSKKLPTKGIVDGIITIADLKFKVYKEFPFNAPTT